MTVKHYRRENNTYYGAYEELIAPGDAVEVDSAPFSATHIWNGSQWVGSTEQSNPQDLTTSIAVAYATGDIDVSWEVFSFLDAIRFGGYDGTLRKLVWSRLKADSPDWLTEALKTKMIAWSVSAKCPLE